MKRVFSAFILLLAVSSCSFSFKTDMQIMNAIKNKGKAVSVTVTDGAEANVGGFTGSDKEIFVDMGGDKTPNREYILNIAYHCADTAYKITLANKSKMPDIFRIRVKAGGMTSDNCDFKSAYLAKDNEIEQKIKVFMDALLQKRYNNLAGYMENKNIDMTSIVNIFKNADAANQGLISYKFIALQHAMGVNNTTQKPIPVIQGWVLIKGQGSDKQYPILFVINPADYQLSSIYVNPGKNN